MIEWGSPAAFWLLLPVLLLGARRRMVGIRRLAIGRIASMERRWTVRLVLAPLPGVLGFLGLTLMVLALARPRITQTDTLVESDGLDIMLAVDTSGSMRAEDLSRGIRKVDRLVVAKEVMAEFISTRPHDRIGVVVFGAEAFTYVPLTLDHQSLLDILGDLEIGVAGAEGTAIGSALAVSAKRLKDLAAPSRLIILLTDGRNNAGRISPLEAAQAAKALGIKIYAVGVGSRRPALLAPFGDGLDAAGLTAIAETTGGRFFRAADPQSLQEIYDTIDELEPSPAEVRQLVSHTELFRWFLVPSVLLLATQQILGATWLRRSP